MQKKFIVIIIFIFLLIGCAGVETEVHSIFEEDYWDKVGLIVKSNNLEVGMSEVETENFMGVANEKIENLNPYGNYEEWIYKPVEYYDDPAFWIYLSFKNGKLVNIQNPSNF